MNRRPGLAGRRFGDIGELEGARPAPRRGAIRRRRIGRRALGLVSAFVVGDQRQVPAPQLLATQIAAWMAAGLPPHWRKHCCGEPPLFTQPMRHWSSAVQAGLAKHDVAWAQHLPAMQSPQAVPSGAQVGAPQTPPLHWPVQHCAALAHMVPSGWQAFTHTPLPQVPEQHSEKTMHGPPLAVHLGGPQVPCVLHGPLQQG